ncbi:hypothetical protein BC567DRAFT_296264 [Phyllosticta citribraziliensis]
MAEDTALGPLKAGLREMLESGLYADLQLHCSDGSFYNVHKMVLCSQSAFFKSAVDPRNNFSDPYSNRIRLDKDEPAAVRALLEYLYRFEYDVPRDNDKGALFLFHIKVCAIGEAYGVKGLRDQAIDRAKIVFENAATVKDLRMDLAIKAIYEMDVASDSGLRHLIVELCTGKIHELLEIGEFSEAMDAVGCFGNDLVRALVSTLPPSTALTTPKSAASASDVSIPLAIKGPSHGASAHSNTRASAVDAPGMSTAQENAQAVLGKSAKAFQHLVAKKNGRLKPSQSHPPSIGSLPMTNPNPTAVSQPATAPKSISVLGHVNVPGLTFAPRSKLGAFSRDFNFIPHTEKEKDTFGKDVMSHFEDIEFQTSYQGFSREEIRLSDYSSRSGSMLFGIGLPSCVTAPTNSQVQFPSEAPFGASFGSAPTTLTNTQSQSSPKPLFGTRFGNAPTASTGTQGQSSSKSLFGAGIGSAPTTSTSTQAQSSSKPLFGTRFGSAPKASTSTQGRSSSPFGVPFGSDPTASTSTQPQSSSKPLFGTRFGSAPEASTSTQGQSSSPFGVPFGSDPTASTNPQGQSTSGLVLGSSFGGTIAAPNRTTGLFSGTPRPATGPESTPALPSCLQGQSSGDKPSGKSKRSNSVSSTQSQKEAYELLFGKGSQSVPMPSGNQKGKSSSKKKKSKAKAVNVTTEVPC